MSTYTTIAEGAHNAQPTVPQPPAPWPAAEVADLCAGYAKELAYREADAYVAGIEIGIGIGRRQVEEEYETHWAMVSRNIRANAGRPSYSQRRVAELERAKPKPGDFTGRLTAAEYFGTGLAA